MSDITARVSRRDRQYKITPLGRVAIAKFLEPEYTFSISDLGPNDRVTLSLMLTDSGTPGTGLDHVDVELPAGLVEEVS